MPPHQYIDDQVKGVSRCGFCLSFEVRATSDGDNKFIQSGGETAEKSVKDLVLGQMAQNQHVPTINGGWVF